MTSRGNEGRKVFFSKSDYEKFLDYLKLAQEKFGYLLHAYVLMNGGGIHNGWELNFT